MLAQGSSLPSDGKKKGGGSSSPRLLEECSQQLSHKHPKLHTTFPFSHGRMDKLWPLLTMHYDAATKKPRECCPQDESEHGETKQCAPRHGCEFKFRLRGWGLRNWEGTVIKRLGTAQSVWQCLIRAGELPGEREQQQVVLRRNVLLCLAYFT